MATEQLTIPSTAGQLELLIHAIPNAQSVAVVCHPHPLMGGTMHNKVVTTLAKVFHQLHISTIRFQFRGIGLSSGEFDAGIGETQDALTVIDFAKRYFSHDVNFYLSGFSFGALVAWRTAYLTACKQLILTAPPVVSFHAQMQNHLPLPCPWIVAQGEQDEVVAAQDVTNWCEHQSRPPEKIILFPNTSHFFHGKLIDLQNALLPLIQLK